ncbi:MAG: hypothetical protein ABIX01_05135 [Chitinophagaceae bacterium]
METVVVKPRNKEELELVASLMKRMNIRSSIQKKETGAGAKKKAKETFLNSLPDRLNQTKLHMEGKNT